MSIVSARRPGKGTRGETTYLKAASENCLPDLTTSGLLKSPNKMSLFLEDCRECP